MSERTTIGGTVYEAIGSSSSNLLLKCNGTARIQWGDKLIDLVKNGKIACEKAEVNSIHFRGMIVMVSNGVQIPEGWALCDGKEYTYNGVSLKTPDLTKLNQNELLYIIKL